VHLNPDRERVWQLSAGDELVVLISYE